MGALPGLRAATGPGVLGGQYYGPGGLLRARGYPKLAHSEYLCLSGPCERDTAVPTGVEPGWLPGKAIGAGARPVPGLRTRPALPYPLLSRSAARFLATQWESYTARCEAIRDRV